MHSMHYLSLSDALLYSEFLNNLLFRQETISRKNSSYYQVLYSIRHSMRAFVGNFFFFNSTYFRKKQYSDKLLVFNTQPVCTFTFNHSRFALFFLLVPWCQWIFVSVIRDTFWRESEFFFCGWQIDDIYVNYVRPTQKFYWKFYPNKNNFVC